MLPGHVQLKIMWLFPGAQLQAPSAQSFGKSDWFGHVQEIMTTVPPVVVHRLPRLPSGPASLVPLEEELVEPLELLVLVELELLVVELLELEEVLLAPPPWPLLLLALEALVLVDPAVWPPAPLVAPVPLLPQAAIGRTAKVAATGNAKDAKVCFMPRGEHARAVSSRGVRAALALQVVVGVFCRPPRACRRRAPGRSARRGAACPARSM